MPTLALHQSELGPDRYRVAVSSDLPGLTLTHSVDFDYRLAPADQEAIRWYLEDYLKNPFDPNPKIAARTEERLAEIGRELFETVFASREMDRFWTRAMDQLDTLRVEIATSVAAATAIPWELLRDPQTGAPLAIRAAEFVRNRRGYKPLPPPSAAIGASREPDTGPSRFGPPPTPPPAARPPASAPAPAPPPWCRW